MLAGVYQTPAVYVNVKGVMTNTVPIDAYRGAGRPEAAYLLERFVDHIAREIGLAPDEIRARNFIKPSQIPFTTALGDTTTRRLRSGDAQGHGEGRLEGLPARRAESLAKGKWRGIGMATYVEKCGRRPPETAIAKFNDDGTVTIYLGNQTNGQGHETAIAPDRLGAARHRRRADPGRAGRHRRRARGLTGGSRMVVGRRRRRPCGVADKIIAKGKLVAASGLEAARGRHRISATARSDRRHRPQP